MLELLSGISRNARARRALAAHGFSDADYEEGWRLLRAANQARFAPTAVAEDADPTLLADLDVWENKWFPIVEATLRRHHPAVHVFCFNGLKQAEGPAVILSVSTLLERLRALETPTAETKGLADRKKARELVAKRGLTKAVVAQAQSILEQIGTFVPAPEEEVTVDDEAKRVAAETAMWDWYLEWSQIVQSVLTDRRALRQLGFLKTARKPGAPEPESDEIEPELEEDVAADDVGMTEPEESSAADPIEVPPSGRARPSPRTKAPSKPAAGPKAARSKRRGRG